MPVLCLTTIKESPSGWGPAQHCYNQHVSCRLQAWCATHHIQSLQLHNAICLVIALLSCISFCHFTSVHLTVVLSNFHRDHSFEHFAIDVRICHISHVHVILLCQVFLQWILECDSLCIMNQREGEREEEGREGEEGGKEGRRERRRGGKKRREGEEREGSRQQPHP